MIIPRVQKEQELGGKLMLPKTITVTVSDEASRKALNALKLFLEDVAFEMVEDGIIKFISAPLEKSESYTLKIDNDIKIFYSDFLSARNAVATFAQMLTPGGEGYFVTKTNIEDFPEYSVRSFLIDFGRGIGRKDELKELLVRLALFKYNRIHLHLMDTQGVAWQSVRYPKLKGPKDDQFSMQFWKSIHELCVTLGLEIMPEIEVPGHSRTILANYPEYSCVVDEKKYPTKWTACAGNEELFTFYKNLIAEIIEMFPSCKTIHIGGDEVHLEDSAINQCYWRICPRCAKLGHIDLEETFLYVIKRTYDIVKSFGKQVAMWNDWIDISKPCTLPKDIEIFFWRVAQEGRGPCKGCSMQKFLEQGYRVVNAYYEDTYFCYDYAVPETVNTWTPISRPEVDEKYHNLVVGADACAWNWGDEPLFRHYRYSLDSRLGLFADRLWNTSVQPYDDAYATAVTRAVLGLHCPESFNIYKYFGTLMPVLNYPPAKEITDATPYDEQIDKAIISMVPIIVSDMYGHCTALFYTECLNWIKNNKWQKGRKYSAEKEEVNFLT